MNSNKHFPKKTILLCALIAAFLLFSVLLVSLLVKRHAVAVVEPSAQIVEGNPPDTEITTETGEIRPDGKKYDYTDKDYEGTAGTEGSARYGQTNYINGQVFSYAYNAKGDTISVGVENGNLIDGIYLNPKCSAATADSKVAFYLQPSRVPVILCDDEGAPATDEKNKDSLNYIITDRTYDTLVSASYENTKNFGAKWANDYFVDGQMDTGTTIYMRAVRLKDDYLLAICKVEIKYDNSSGKYQITGISSADVKDTGELSDTDRQKIVEDAVDFMMSSTRGPDWKLGFDDYREQAIKQAKVDHPPALYFDRLINTKNEPISSGKYSVRCEVYAVSFPFPGFGFFTVYYAPQLQLDGMKSPYAPGSTDLNLVVFGYDAARPFAKDKLIVPAGF